MKPRIKAGLVGGIFGGLLTIVTGGLAAYFGAIVAGTIAGILATQNEHPETIKQGGRQGLEAGLIAGIMIFVAQMIYGQVILPAINRPFDIGNDFMLGMTGFVLTAVIAIIFGVVRSLPHPRDTYGLYGAIGILVLLYPWLDRWLQLGFMNEVIPILVFILMALGLNIVVGYAGLLDLGYAAFFAIGAYTTGMLSSPHFGINLSFWVAIWIAAAVAAVFGLILGAPTLPLRGDYLAIVTLGFGEIVPIAANNLDRLNISILGYKVVENFNLTGGPKGINPISRPSFPGIGTFRAADQMPWFYLILAIMVFSIFFILRLRNSRLGRAWAAMREDEMAAQAMGINIVQTKLLAFAMGATFSGFAGAFYGSYISAIFPDSFRFDVSVMLLCMVILGGLGNMTGVILGGLIIQFADRIFLPHLAELIQSLAQNSNNAMLKEINFASDFRLLLFGATLVIMMLLRPEGLLPNERIRREMHADEHRSDVISGGDTIDGEPNESAGLS